MTEQYRPVSMADVVLQPVNVKPDELITVRAVLTSDGSLLDLEDYFYRDPSNFLDSSLRAILACGEERPDLFGIIKGQLIQNEGGRSLNVHSFENLTPELADKLTPIMTRGSQAKGI